MSKPLSKLDIFALAHKIVDQLDETAYERFHLNQTDSDVDIVADLIRQELRPFNNTFGDIDTLDALRPMMGAE